jgi:hypothetical protein
MGCSIYMSLLVACENRNLLDSKVQTACFHVSACVGVLLDGSKLMEGIFGMYYNAVIIQLASTVIMDNYEFNSIYMKENDRQHCQKQLGELPHGG